ncbi:MAG: hypothetical protein ISF22_07510 [Methanomassiliicoccus sp.]|nr:hypothetical protein [Methanomassiliicoccus sp.]
MDGERISLRLELEDLELLDSFIEKHPEYSNRSNFARVAIRSFIDQADGTATAVKKHVKKENVITVEVPRLAHETIMTSVRAGIYNSPEEAVVWCIRKEFIKIEQTLEMIKNEKQESLKGAMQMISE